MTKYDKLKDWLKRYKYKYIPEMNLYTRFIKELSCAIYINIEWADKLSSSSMLDKISHGILSDYLYINIANIADINTALSISDKDYQKMIKECIN